MINDVLRTGGIALIAVAIAGAILYRYIQYGPSEQIPQPLGNAFTLIIGFYFGTAASRGGKGRAHGIDMINMLPLKMKRAGRLRKSPLEQ